MADWKVDDILKSDLENYVRQNLKRSEILDYMKRDYVQYKWSLATLDRCLRFFDIRYIDYDVPLETVADAVQKELDGPGTLLGYRAMNQKLRIEHNVKVPRHLVHKMMWDLDPEGVEGRKLQKKAKPAKKPFTSEGPLWVVSLDGHDKLCGYQNSTFPLGVYGCMDTFSRKILFIFVCYSNSNPLIVGKKYLEYLYKSEMLPRFLRIDKGTETGKMATIHCYLIDYLGIMDDALHSIIYGPSTSNKIERWWRDLNERLERYFKVQLNTLLRGMEYDPHNISDRQILAFVYIPIIQRECEVFVNYWNSHRIRYQENLEIPTGVPEHIFDFPDQYGGMNMGTHVAQDQLQGVAEVSGVMSANVFDFIDEDLAHQCSQYLPNVDKIACADAIDAFRFLKNKVTH